MLIFRRMNSLFSKILLSISIILVIGCATHPIKSNDPIQNISQHYFSKSFPKGLVYKATFKYKEKSISGLMVIKDEEQNHTHIQLLTHLGPTLMDVTLTDEKMIVHQNLEKMNKKIILNNLEKDLRQIVLNPLLQDNIKKISAYKNTGDYKVKTRFGKYKVQLNNDKSINKVVRLGMINGEKVVTEYDDVNNDLPKKITLYHKNLNFRIELNLLKRF